jgi:hypothetical protein
MKAPRSDQNLTSPGAAGRGGIEELPTASDLTSRALELRGRGLYATHPVEASLRYHRSETGAPGEEGHGGLDFETASRIHRAGAQGLRLPEIPQLPQRIAELSRLAPLDWAGRTALRRWAEDHGPVIDETEFLDTWNTQGRRGGAEHHVYHDQEKRRWFKRLYHGVNHSTLGDYFDRLRLHAVLFPESAYRLEGFTINSKNKELAPIVSQPHVEVDISRPTVSKSETDALMAAMGFAAVQLYHDGLLDDGYFAYLHPVTGVLVHDMHDENVVRIPDSDDLGVIDPFISLARRGTWAGLKLAEVGMPLPPDDDLDA